MPRLPKKFWKNGSSINGYCCGARTRLSEWIVTTAGATRLTTSAYEMTGPELVAATPLLAGSSVALEEAKCMAPLPLRLQAPTNKTHIVNVKTTQMETTRCAPSPATLLTFITHSFIYFIRPLQAGLQSVESMACTNHPQTKVCATYLR